MTRSWPSVQRGGTGRRRGLAALVLMAYFPLAATMDDTFTTDGGSSSLSGPKLQQAPPPPQQERMPRTIDCDDSSDGATAVLDESAERDVVDALRGSPPSVSFGGMRRMAHARTKAQTQTQRRKKRFVDEVSLVSHRSKSEEMRKRQRWVETSHGLKDVPLNQRDYNATGEDLLEEVSLEDVELSFRENNIRVEDWGNDRGKESLLWLQNSRATEQERSGPPDTPEADIDNVEGPSAEGLDSPRHDSRLEQFNTNVTSQSGSAGSNIATTSDQYLTLNTPFDGSNGSYGTMFDVTHTYEFGPPVLVRSLALHVNVVANSCPVQVFTKKGSHRGFESDMEVWTMLFDGMIQCRGFKSRSIIPAALFSGGDSLASSMLGGTSGSGSVLRIDQGETRAFYVHLPQPNLRYTNGKEPMEMTWADANIFVRAGTGMGGKFTDPYSPRHWNGVLYYETLEALEEVETNELKAEGDATWCDGVIETTFLDTIGSYGSMFDVFVPSESNSTSLLSKLSNGVVITSMEIYTDVDFDVRAEVYTRPGSFENGMSDLSGWSLIAAGSLKGAGSYQGTLIPPELWFRNVTIAPGSVSSFYVTLTTADLRYTKVDEVEVEKALTSSDDYLEIRVGVGVADYPLGTTFYGPRIWNGRLYYRTVGDGSECHLTSARTDEPTISLTIPLTLQPTDAPTVPSFRIIVVTYTYYVEHPAYVSRTQLFRDVDKAVHNAVSGFMLNTDPLGQYVSAFGLWLDEAESALGGEGDVQRE